MAERVADERCESSPGSSESLVGYQVRLDSARYCFWLPKVFIYTWIHNPFSKEKGYKIMKLDVLLTQKLLVWKLIYITILVPAKLLVLRKTSQLSLRGWMYGFCIVISLGLCIIISFDHFKHVLIRSTMHDSWEELTNKILLIGSEKWKDLSVEFYDTWVHMDSQFCASMLCYFYNSHCDLLLFSQRSEYSCWVMFP